MRDVGVPALGVAAVEHAGAVEIGAPVEVGGGVREGVVAGGVVGQRGYSGEVRAVVAALQVNFRERQ